MTIKAHLFLKAHAALGEGPRWDDQGTRLFWVDIMGERLYRTDPETRQSEEFPIGQPVGAMVLDNRGGVVLAVEEGFAAFDLATRQLTMLWNPEPDLPGNRFNDGACDPAGRFWAGTMAYSLAEGAGSLYRLDPDGSGHTMISKVTISNGIGWSSDHSQMFFIDSIPGTVSCFDYDEATGDIRNRRVAIHISDGLGLPDGMAVDADDKLWIAHYGDGCVRRWDPDTATILETIPIPTQNVTACAFGGPDLDTLFITTAGGDDPTLLEKEPLAGCLFLAHPGVQGQPAFRFVREF